MSTPKLKLSAATPRKLNVDVLALPVFDGELTSRSKSRRPELAAVSRPLRGLLEGFAKDERFRGSVGQSLVVQTHGKLPASRILLLGLGKKGTGGAHLIRTVVAQAARFTRGRGGKKLGVVLPADLADADGVRAAAEGALLGNYRFDRYKSTGPKSKVRPALREVHLVVADARNAELVSAAHLGTEIACATNLARDLVNEPAGAVTPKALAAEARALAKEFKLSCSVFGMKDLDRLKMGMFRGVAQGSDEEPQLIILQYTPAQKRTAKKSKKKATKGKAGMARGGIAFVGKGVTFDSGGYDLKSAAFMLDMKIDMGGAAAALSAMRAVAAIAPPFPVTAYAGACENMVSGHAYKPGDVLVSRQGKTVEINNTDAEGRLVLGDVLNYASEQGHEAIVDLATLTGACMVALGPYTIGCFANDDSLANAITAAGADAGESMWRMPMIEDLKEHLRSNIADLRNTGERAGGAITAALFLREFVGKTPWVHLDIAGPAHQSKIKGVNPKGASGAGVRTLAQWVIDRAAR